MSDTPTPNKSKLSLKRDAASEGPMSSPKGTYTFAGVVRAIDSGRPAASRRKPYSTGLGVSGEG